MLFRERGICMKKEIALKPPCREYDVQGMESWLQYQSLSGNRLFDTAGRTFYFQEAEPKKLVFRLEPHGKKQISEEQKEDWKKRGWSYAASYRRLYDIFFSETEERDEGRRWPLPRAWDFSSWISGLEAGDFWGFFS